MNELAAEKKIRFIAALIPTKELVFKELWNTPSENFRILTDNESRFWKMTKYFLEENGIEYVDVLPALRTQLAEGIQPYQVSNDGHPNEHGHQAIARLIHAQLQKKQGAE
jgi:lysophospholipase L1-like esterase